MNKITISAALLTAGVFLTLSPQAHAQALVNWGSGAQLISGDSNVDDTGTAALAFDENDFYNDIYVAGGPYSTVVNGVTFSGAETQGAYVFNPTGAYYYQQKGLAGNNPLSLSTNYADILNTRNYATTAFQLEGLNSGDTYDLQIFLYNDSYNSTDNGSGASETFSPSGYSSDGVTLEYISDSPSTYPPGEYAIGTFVASGTSETINIAGGEDFTAVNLRDEGVEAVPEPSTYILLGAGVLALVVMNRRRISSVS